MTVLAASETSTEWDVPMGRVAVSLTLGIKVWCLLPSYLPAWQLSYLQHTTVSSVFCQQC